MSDPHFNNLTPAEAERLAILAEEAGEIVQIVGKILRHGYESFHPGAPGKTNRDLLTDEVNDMRAAIFLIHNDLSAALTDGPMLRALDRKMQWTHHQGKRA